MTNVRSIQCRQPEKLWSAKAPTRMHSEPDSRSHDNATGGACRGRQSEEGRRQHTTEVQMVDDIEHVGSAGEHFETERVVIAPCRRPSIAVAACVFSATLPEAQTPGQIEIDVLGCCATATIPSHADWSLVG